jgi:hypothetical protein
VTDDGNDRNKGGMTIGSRDKPRHKGDGSKVVEKKRLRLHDAPSNVVNEQRAGGAAVVGARNGSEALLAGLVAECGGPR